MYWVLVQETFIGLIVDLKYWKEIKYIYISNIFNWTKTKSFYVQLCSTIFSYK